MVITLKYMFTAPLSVANCLRHLVIATLTPHHPAPSHILCPLLNLIHLHPPLPVKVCNAHADCTTMSAPPTVATLPAPSLSPHHFPISPTLASYIFPHPPCTGLCDAHVHCTAVSANLSSLLSLPESYVAAKAATILEGMLCRGFTTVRDAGVLYTLCVLQATDDPVLLSLTGRPTSAHSFLCSGQMSNEFCFCLSPPPSP